MSESNPRITYAPHPDATPETELNSLAAVYRFILDCRAHRLNAEPGSRDDAAIARNTEQVSRVEQRPDRQSEIPWPARLWPQEHLPPQKPRVRKKDSQDQVA